MKQLFFYQIILLFCCIETFVAQPARIPAFPGAEGFGAWTTGGREGIVYQVTNLNDNGPGSLREGIRMNVQRTIVFRVSGTIKLDSALVIRNDNITIAGQTAPGDGICIRNHTTIISANNVIIRHLRFRLGDEDRVYDDALRGNDVKNIIIDHCSMSWGIDETVSLYNNDSITIQWCIISESLDNSLHEKGPHGYGGIWGGRGATFHHNLFAHHKSRTPRFASSRDYEKMDQDLVDFRNNVIYNWGENNIYGGEKRKHNIVANYFKPGPATTSGSKEYRIFNPYKPFGKFFINKNFVYGFPMATEDNWTYGVQGLTEMEKEQIKQYSPFTVAQITETTAQQAYFDVIEKVGATVPKRDVVDKRILEDVINGRGTHGATYKGGGKGIIDSQTDVGGWPSLPTYNVPVDSDHDGMPDDWEITQGLDPNDPEDRNNVAQNEIYTNLERYLNELTDNVVRFIQD